MLSLVEFLLAKPVNPIIMFYMVETFTVKERADLGMGHYEMIGSMNETSKFPPLVNVGVPIIINMERVVKTNSPGLQLWIKWVRTFDRMQEVRLVKVPDHFVMSASMVESILSRNFVIESFYVPYVNLKTNLQQKILLTLGKDYQPNAIIVNKRFSDMEIDVSPERFFLCLKRINPGMIVTIK